MLNISCGCFVNVWNITQDVFAFKIAQQQKQIEALTATVQKVSEQIELNKPVPQIAANN
jgi:cell division protein FtsB